MKVRVTITLDIDPDAWALEYGCDVDEVREDVRAYVTNSTYANLAGLGLLTNGAG
jgi:hypothetical protein